MQKPKTPKQPKNKPESGTTLIGWILKMKSVSRTTLIGWILMALLILAFVGVFNGSITLNDYGGFLGIIFGLLISIGFIFSKDG